MPDKTYEFKCIGYDFWSQPLYTFVGKATGNIITLVEVDGELHTRTDEPWCEPLTSLGIFPPESGKDFTWTKSTI